jgi:hypothetical protein
MHRLPRGLVMIALPALALAAILGYVAGHRGGRATGRTPAGREPSHVLSVGDLLLEVPAGWQRTGAAPTTSGLRLEGEVVVAQGSARDSGLFGGRLAPGQQSPLPTAFVSTLDTVPQTQILDFLGAQAYEYAGLSIRGYPHGLDLYVVPNASTAPTVLGCYATPALSTHRAACQQIVSKLTLVGQSQNDLNPDPAYAEALGKRLRSLDTERLAIRRQMRASTSPLAVGALSKQLAAHLAATASSLSTLEVPLAVGEAQTALADAIVHARDAYQAMARAAASELLSSYDEALVRVERADDGIDAALATFALLGYSRT